MNIKLLPIPFLVINLAFVPSLLGKTLKPKTENPEAASPAREHVSHGDSTAARSSKIAGVGIQYTPLSDFILSQGLFGAYYVNSDLQLGGAYLTGSKTLDSSSTDSTSTFTSKATLKGSFGQVYAKYFVGNTFNVTSGLGLRTATIDYSIADNSGINISGKIEIQSVVIPLFIGNAWSWQGGFTLGVDWIGVLIPISGGTKSSLSGNLDSATSKSLNEDMLALGDSLAKKSSLTLLLTSVGWAF